MNKTVENKKCNKSIIYEIKKKKERLKTQKCWHSKKYNHAYVLSVWFGPFCMNYCHSAA